MSIVILYRVAHYPLRCCSNPSAFALSRYLCKPKHSNHYRVNDVSVMQTSLSYVCTITTNTVREAIATSSHTGSVPAVTVAFYTSAYACRVFSSLILHDYIHACLTKCLQACQSMKLNNQAQQNNHAMLSVGDVFTDGLRISGTECFMQACFVVTLQ